MKVSHCEYCGDDLGGAVDKWSGEIITCGKRECEQYAHEEQLAAREEAHDKLDHGMGWK